MQYFQRDVWGVRLGQTKPAGPSGTFQTHSKLATSHTIIESVTLIFIGEIKCYIVNLRYSKYRNDCTVPRFFTIPKILI